MEAPGLVATRIHGEHVLRDDPTLDRLTAFLRGAESAGAAAVLVAVGEEHGKDPALVGAVRKAVQEYRAAVQEHRPQAKVVSVHVVPVWMWTKRERCDAQLPGYACLIPSLRDSGRSWTMWRSQRRRARGIRRSMLSMYTNAELSRLV